MMRNRARWDRKLWGIVLRGTRDEQPTTLIGSLWLPLEQQGKPYSGEPTRPLLFCTRELARAYCARKNAEYKARGKGDILSTWRMRPVRVRELVSPTT